MSKYKKIQREKLSEKGKSIYDKLKKVSNNFEKTEGKVGEALEKFYKKVEKSAVEQPKAEPKKAPAKKKPAAKKQSKAKKNAGRPKSKKKAKPKRASYRNGNMGNFAKLAKKIRDEEGISYREAQKKASKIYADLRAEEDAKKKDKFKAEISHFKKKYKGRGTRGTTIDKDAQIPAKSVGKRISKDGNVYYEYRDNRTDQKQPQPSKYPRLAKGGKVKRDWSNYYEDGGMVASYDVRAPFGTYAKGGTIMSKPMQDRLIDKNGERKIDRESIKVLTNYVNSLEQTKDKHQKNGVYSESRKKLHKDIIDDFKKNVVCIESNKPIAILMGGSPASGKSTFLRKYAPYLLKEEILRIDADEVRSMLPEYEGWNASQTHLETKDIVNTLLSDRVIGLPCETDIIYDGTMNSNKSYLPLIKVLRKLGYEIFVVYIDKVPKDVIVDRALKRYGKSGRFVPLEVIDDFFGKGKTALNEIKKKVDGYMIVDGSGGDYKIIEEGGMKLPKTRKYGQIGTPMKKKLEFGGDITQSFDVKSPYGTYAKGGRLKEGDKFSYKTPVMLKAKNLKVKMVLGEDQHGATQYLTENGTVVDDKYIEFVHIPYAKGGKLEQEPKMWLRDLFYAVRDREIEEYPKIAEKLDSLGVSFITQNEVAELGVDARTKNLNADDVTKLLSKYAKGGKVSKETDYISNRDIVSVTIKKGGKEKTLKGSDILDGIYVSKISNAFGSGASKKKSGKGNKAYVDFLNKDNGYKLERKYFKTYRAAEKWAKNEFERFDQDMISYTEFEKPLKFAKGGWIQEAEAEMEKKGTVGVFSKKAKKAGMKTDAYAKKVLASPEKYSEATRKQAQFAVNVMPKGRTKRKR